MLVYIFRLLVSLHGTKGHPAHGAATAGVISSLTCAFVYMKGRSQQSFAKSFLDGLAIFVLSWIMYAILGGNEGKMWNV